MAFYFHILTKMHGQNDIKAGLDVHMDIRNYSIPTFCCVTTIKGNSSIHRLFQITNLMHNSFILQQYICYTTLLNMFRAARYSSSGGQIVSPQPLVSSPSVSSRTVCRWRVDLIGPPDDEQHAARNMLRIIM